MMRNHSFPARCLAMLLAVVLVLTTASVGLATHAQAANGGNLFELIAASNCGTEKMNAVLDYADVLNNLNDETVEYPAAPEAAVATLRQGVLKVEAVDGWVPYTYAVNGITTAFDETYTANVGEETTEASVVYKLDLNKDDSVAAALGLVADLADEAAKQADALNAVSGTKAMTALGMLDYFFIEDMIAAVDALTYEDLGVEADQDLNEDGMINELDQLIAEKALEEVKKEYKQIIGQLIDRCVAEGDPYYEYKNSKGKREYEDQLRVYAMLKEYKKNDGGLAHFYKNASDFTTELEVLGNCLFDILGEYDAATGKYANDAVVNALLVEMDYADEVTAANLADMAGRMINAAGTLKTLTAYMTEIDTKSADLAALCDALVACGSVSEYSTDLCLYTKSLTVVDDSWKYVQITLEGTEIVLNWRAETDEVLDEQDIAAICDYIKTKAPYYTVDTAKVNNLVGTKMTENVSVSCAAELNVYNVEIKNQAGNVLETIEVPGDAATITLPVRYGHEVTYAVDGQLMTITDATEVEANMAKIAAGTFEIIVIEDINLYKDTLVGLVDELNNQIGAGSFSLVEENGEYVGLTANIAIRDLVVFASTVLTSDFVGEEKTIYLNDKEFMFVSDGEYQVSIQALIEALLHDESFSSEKMIAMGEGETNNLLNSTMQLPGYDLDFTLNLSTMPEQMAKVSKGLKAIEDYMWFETNDGILDVSVNIPEKVYEAYLTGAIGLGRMDDDNVAELNNLVVMQFVADYFELLVNSDVTTTTLTNTLNKVGVQKDLTGYEEYYQLLKKAAAGEGFQYEISEQYVDVSVSGNSNNIETVLAILGIDSKDLNNGLKLVAEEPLAAKSVVTLVNEAPDFQALVVDPGKVNDAGIKTKISAIDYTTNVIDRLSAVNTHAAVVLLDDVNGNLNFPGSAVLDLNGNTVNGNVTAKGTLIIVDSALDTYNGGAVTGTVSANRGAITGGTYGSDVSSFLKDGYIQDNGSVRNAMYYIENNNGNFEFVVNADFYQLCDGYVPSVKALAVDIAADVAMNFYPAVGMSYGSETLYSLNIDDILNSYLGNGADGAIDALLDDVAKFVHADGVNALANDIIDDLCDFEALSAALNAGETLASYNFSVNPITVEVERVDSGDYIDFSIVADTNAGKSFGVALTIDGSNKYFNFTKDLLTAMAEILTVDAQVELIQPEYNAETNTFSVAGNASADVTLDLSGNSDYTKGIAIILAYGNEEWREELVNAKNCVVVLNKIIAQMTVEDVFNALKVMSRDVSMTEMADAIGYKYAVEEIAALEEVYHVLLCGIGKGYEVMEANGNTEPVGSFVKNYSEYYKAVAILLAYGREEWSDDLLNAKDAAVVLKNIVAQMSVQDFFNALKVIDRQVTLSEMADAIGYKYTSEEIATLEGVYDTLKEIDVRVTVKEMADAIGYEYGSTEHSTLEDVREVLKFAVGKVGDKLHINNNDNVLGDYQTNSFTYTYSKSVSSNGDVTVKGYTAAYDVTSLEVSVTVKLAPKCTKIIGDVNWNDLVNSDDAAWVLKYDAELATEEDLHLCLGDVNADGFVDTDDAAWILKYDAELIEYEEFPAVNP